MAIKLIANYSKRLGLPGYSSHQFSVSVESELSASDDIAAESTRLYHLLQSNVDEQMLRTGFVPPGDYGMEGSQSGSTDPGSGVAKWQPGADWKCSSKQKDLILKIVDEHALDKNEVDHLARQRFGKGVRQLNKIEASGLIDELLDTYGSSQRPADREKCRQDGLRVIAAYLDSPEAMQEKPRAVEVMLREEIPGLSVPLTGAMDLVLGNLTPVDFKSASAKPDPVHAAFDHEIQLVSYQLLMEAATGESPPSLDLVFLVKTKTPQVIRVSSPPADAHRKRRVTALLETAASGIGEGRYHLIKNQVDIHDPEVLAGITAKLQEPEYADALQLWSLASLPAKQRTSTLASSLTQIA